MFFDSTEGVAWRTLIPLYLDDFLLMLRSLVPESALASDDDREWSARTVSRDWSFAWYKGISNPFGMYVG
jgi:hypothetical protein